VSRLPLVDCAACGAEVDPARALPFRCPNADARPEVDHILTPRAVADSFPTGNEANPFLRYREWTLAYRLARRAGLSEAGYADLVERLDEALVRVDGRGFRVTPFAARPDLAPALGLPKLALWVKDETGNVAGSHKGRHLMAVMLYLQVLAAGRLPAGEGLRSRRLAIASCGNAALAAAVVARAADWPLDVFIPPDASPVVVARLKDLGATVHICEREAGVAGDPCFLAYQRAVAGGALSFGIQGTDNGLSVEGSRTLAYEMAETLARSGQELDALFVQVGGGALASGLWYGLVEMEAMGVLTARPRLFAVQTQGCHPLERAHGRLAQWTRANNATVDTALTHAAFHRAEFMAPWDTAPHSIAHGILDDETYDWLSVTEGMLRTGGGPVIASETELETANRVGRTVTGLKASHTGTAGLAGVLAARPTGNVAVLFSGVER